MNPVLRIATALTMVGALAGCVAQEVWAPDAAVSAASYRPNGGPTITLMTMISNTNGSGGHSALLIDGTERVLFDPAGSWYHPMIPERNDVLYGMGEPFLGFYKDYHARATYHIVVHEVDVTPEVAASVIAAVERAGPVPSARCSFTISTILSQTPGFESINPSWFPGRMMQRFSQIDGVRESRIYDDDDDNNLELLQAQARAELTRARMQAALGQGN